MPKKTYPENGIDSFGAEQTMREGKGAKQGRYERMLGENRKIIGIRKTIH